MYVCMYVWLCCVCSGVACALWTLAVVTTLCTVVIAKLLPETGKASLEDIGRENVTNASGVHKVGSRSVGERKLSDVTSE